MRRELKLVSLRKSASERLAKGEQELANARKLPSSMDGAAFKNLGQ